jgi:hypothetical protein
LTLIFVADFYASAIAKYKTLLLVSAFEQKCLERLMDIRVCSKVYEHHESMMSEDAMMICATREVHQLLR